jgi:GNAT superfamily N-acetyltransferase
MHIETEVRPLKRRDLPELLLIAKVHYPTEPWLSLDYLEEREERALVKLGIHSSKRLLGGVIIRQGKRPNVWLSLMVVDRNFTRHGLGEKLFTAAEHQLERGNVIWILLPDAKDFKTSQKFLLKMGFEQSGELKNYFGPRKNVLAYSKKIR